MGTNVTTQSLASLTNDIRDITPPLEIPNPWFWVFGILGLLLVVGLIIGLIVFLVTRPKVVPAAPVIPPHERARRKLEAALSLYDQPKPFCTLVSDAVRWYLEERFELPVSDRTTEEFLAELHSSPVLDAGQKESLKEFLAACDLVKFARYEPGRQELEGLYNSALRLIEETEPQPEAEAAAAQNPPPE